MTWLFIIFYLCYFCPHGCPSSPPPTSLLAIPFSPTAPFFTHSLPHPLSVLYFPSYSLSNPATLSLFARSKSHHAFACLLPMSFPRTRFASQGSLPFLAHQRSSTNISINLSRFLVLGDVFWTLQSDASSMLHYVSHCHAPPCQTNSPQSSDFVLTAIKQPPAHAQTFSHVTWIAITDAMSTACPQCCHLFLKKIIDQSAALFCTITIISHLRHFLLVLQLCSLGKP